jgi:multicomponent Na+:H+ antiporter subunit E
MRGPLAEPCFDFAFFAHKVRERKDRFMSARCLLGRLGIGDGMGVSVLIRCAAFVALWMALAGADPADLPGGLVAVAAATVASLRLAPPGPSRLSPPALAVLVLRVLKQSIVAGMDVAWRALDPRLPLRPGFIVFSSCLRKGMALNTLCTLTSLAPGTLPAGPDSDGRLVIHCLDTGQPVVAHLGADEQLLARALGCAGDV